MRYYSPILAQTYGSCAYGSSGYNTSTACSGTSASPSSTGGSLTNTGLDIMVAVTLACTIIFVALVVRFWKRSSRTAN